MMVERAGNLSRDKSQVRSPAYSRGDDSFRCDGNFQTPSILKLVLMRFQLAPELIIIMNVLRQASMPLTRYQAIHLGPCSVTLVLRSSVMACTRIWRLGHYLRSDRLILRAI